MWESSISVFFSAAWSTKVAYEASNCAEDKRDVRLDIHSANWPVQEHSSLGAVQISCVEMVQIGDRAVAICCRRVVFVDTAFDGIFVREKSSIAV